jgi:hypothetical protein
MKWQTIKVFCLFWIYKFQIKWIDGRLFASFERPFSFSSDHLLVFWACWRFVEKSLIILGTKERRRNTIWPYQIFKPWTKLFKHTVTFIKKNATWVAILIVTFLREMHIFERLYRGRTKKSHSFWHVNF